MKQRFFKSICVVVVFSILLTCLVEGTLFSRELYTAMKHQLRSEAVCLAQALDDGATVPYLQRVSVSNSNTRITLISPNGTVLFENRWDNAHMENHSARPEIQQARQKGYGEAMRDSATIGQQTFYYAVLLEDGSVLRVAHTIDSLWCNVISTLPYMCMFAILALMLAMVIARRQVQRIVVPINGINLEQPLQNEVYDELYPLLQRIDRQNHQITQQMQELAARQQEFVTLTENMNEGLVIINAQGYILSINRRAIQIFDLPQQEYRNKHILLVNRNHQLQRMIEEGLQGHQRELQLNLENRVYQLLSNPIGIEGQVQGLVLLLLDVTEKQQQEQLRREFTANVSHELKTPLTSISGYAEIIAQGLVQPEDVQPFAQKIHSEANRMISLIADIIQLSQLDEGGSQFAREQVALDDVARDVVQRLQPVAQRRDITLTAEIAPVTVYGISQVLQEILYNLCENAIKYNRPQGTVHLTVTAQGRQAVVQVQDTGIGIPHQEQRRVFERFYRVDKSHSRIIGGTGLGLSIVKHGVQLHQGEITLESQLGIGTTVTVKLPGQQSSAE